MCIVVDVLPTNGSLVKTFKTNIKSGYRKEVCWLCHFAGISNSESKREFRTLLLTQDSCLYCKYPNFVSWFHQSPLPIYSKNQDTFTKDIQVLNFKLSYAITFGVTKFEIIDIINIGKIEFQMPFIQILLWNDKFVTRICFRFTITTKNF